MSSETRPAVVVIGIGNRALSDEGVASRVVAEVAIVAPYGVEVVDAGLPGPGLVGLLEGRTKAVIVDAVDAGCEPGKVFRFSPKEVTQPSEPRRYSLHEGNVLEYVKLAEVLGNGPAEVVLIGVQPGSLQPGEQLSPPVEAAIAEAAALVLAEICD
ncbi:MAG: hydrogenase maturation protease [Planctomycetes bacterium]|nr:hydrogenase maturation protease [Planctomycetota bacterium]